VREVTVAVGSLDVVPEALARAGVSLPPDADVVAVMTASAFTGMAEAAVGLAAALAPLGAPVEALMVADRAAASGAYFADRLARADLVVLVDGAALHARAVWRATPLGEGVAAARTVVAVGSVASVLGVVMVDPRGGAPTTGLGRVSGAVTCAPASADQLARTRSLLGADETLAVLGPRAAVLETSGSWFALIEDDLVVTRGDVVVALARL
jgi:hypothetical protein